MIFTEESTQIHVVISAILVITIGLSSGSDWPGGCYGLPQPKSGCKSSEWGSGWWHEDRRPNNQSTARVPQYSHLKGTFTQTITKRYFCIKKKDTGRDKPWPDGQYCIYKSLLKECPSGFVNGRIGWKNKDGPNNNQHFGMVPSGVFTINTRINYCCKVEGSKENSIVLPTNTPFVLLAYNSSECQSVKWARSTQEYLRFSVQEDMTFKGSHPFVDKDHALRYCYYQASNKTVTYQQGTISRYLNRTSIHQERNAAWHIKPSQGPAFQLMVLRFTRFIFHANIHNSYLEVFDGSDESSRSLGRFSSTQSPLGQDLTSSTKQFFVVLHFGDRSGTYDFEFNYHTFFPTGSTTAKTKTSSTSTNSTFPTTQPPTSSPYASSSKVTSSSLYTSSPKVTSYSPYASSSKVTLSSTYASSSKISSTTSIQTSTKYFTQSSSSHYVNITTTNITSSYLRSHDNDMHNLLLYTLLPIGGLVLVTGLMSIIVIIAKRRKKRIAYSRLTSFTIDEIVSELGDNMDGASESLGPSSSRAVLELTQDEQPVTSTRTKVVDTKNDAPDSDDEMICLDRNPPGFPATELQNESTSPRTSVPCRYESDPVPDHSHHVSNKDLRQLKSNEENELNDAERIALIRLLGENQDATHLPKPKEKQAKDQASNF